MNISQPNSHFSPPSPCSSSNYAFSRSPFEDIAKCNQHKFWKQVNRGLKRYFTCLKPMKSRNRDTKTCCNLSSASPETNCNYYSEMNSEERAEKLRSAIVYCKDSFLRVGISNVFSCLVHSFTYIHRNFTTEGVVLFLFDCR